MLVKYVGPHTGGLQQVGTRAYAIAWGEPVDLPDELAEIVLEQAPDHWETLDGSAMLPCSSCERSYKTQGGLDRHVEKEHPAPPETEETQ